MIRSLRVVARRRPTASPRAPPPSPLPLRHLSSPPSAPPPSAPPGVSLADLPYASVRVDASPGSGAALAPFLAAAVPAWASSGRNSVFVELSLADLAGPAGAALAALGFGFHHAAGPRATLLAWLAPGASRVPPHATHQVGCAGVVVDVPPGGPPVPRVLLVKERSPSPLFGRHWKFPGGLAEGGEDFGAAAAREVFEETGVRASFASLLALRHAHGAGYRGRVSDVYVLTRLVPDRAALGDAAVRVALDPVELAEAEWACPFRFIESTPHALNRFAAAVAIADVAAERAAAGLPPLERADGTRAVTDAAALLSRGGGGGGGGGGRRGAVGGVGGGGGEEPPSLGIAQEDWLSAAASKPVRVYRAAAAPRINAAAATPAPSRPPA